MSSYSYLCAMPCNIGPCDNETRLNWELHESWRRHDMKTLAPFLAFCARNPPVAPPHKKVSNAEHWCFSVVSLNKLLNKQSSSHWFETPWSSCDFSQQALHSSIAHQLWWDSVSYVRSESVPCFTPSNDVLYMYKYCVISNYTQICCIHCLLQRTNHHFLV